MSVSALYVDPDRGPYVDILGADACWGVERDAKGYPGPGPVVAHPPCKPWGKLAWSWRRANDRRGITREDERACGPVAVAQVRAYGGVLEHPDGSLLWGECGLPRPFSHLPMTAPHEWALSVDQCDWGHLARKRTWLFFVGVSPRDLPPMPPRGTPTMTIGTKREARGDKGCLPKALRHVTPPAFAEWLVAAARAVAASAPAD